MKNPFRRGVWIFSETTHCVVPQNIHTSPTEGIFYKNPSPLWKFQFNLIHFFKFLGLWESPTPQEFPIPSVGEYGYFLELHIVPH